MKKPLLVLNVCVLATFAVVRVSSAEQTHNVQSAKEVESLIDSGRLNAGDTIVWADGIFRDEELNIEGVDGKSRLPITLRAATPGGVILRGETQFRIGTQWWVIQGFHFDGAPTEANAYNAFQFRSNNGTSAQHVRLTNFAMTNLISEGNTSKWVLVYGRFNTIDHCHFSGKDKKGALITVELGELPVDTSAEHLFERNYFGDVTPQEGTDNETIRIGFSGDQNKPAQCVVRQNLFVRCNGENEIISNKSSYNTYEANSFRQCDGALVLRHGHHARVEGNYFFGDGAKDAGGIRVSDSHHTIVNNYLQDLTGKTWNAAFSIIGGSAPSGGTSDGYQAVDGITFSHNSIFNCRCSILLSKAKGSRAPTGRVLHNLISSPSGPLITSEIPAAGLEWDGNVLHGAPIGAEVDAVTDDPRVREVNGLLSPELGTDSHPNDFPGVTSSTMPLPLNPADVGVSFLRGALP